MKVTPEKVMKKGFGALSIAKHCFEAAVSMYEHRNNEQKADKENAVNIKAAVEYLNKAYDEVRAIYENDL